MNKPDWLNLHPQRPQPILMLGRIDAGNKVVAHKAKTSQKTQDLLRTILIDFLSARSGDQFLPYSDTGIVGEDQTFVGKLDHIVNSTPEIEDEVAEDTGLLVKHIENARHTNGSIALDEFEDHAFTFYMVIAKNAAGEDVAFVRRLRGFKLTNNRWHFMAVGNNDALEVLEKPVFKLDLAFDFALRKADTAVWNVDSFLGLFVDVDALKAAVPSYLETARKGMSAKLTKASAERISAAAMQSIRVAKQIKRISQLDYLNVVTAPAIQAYLEEVSEISGGITVSGDEVELEEGAVQPFLKLVEQRFWRGHFDRHVHEAQAFISPETP